MSSGRDGEARDRVNEHDPTSGQVVNCAEYAEGRRVGDVSLPDVSDVLGANHPSRFVWIGLLEPGDELMHQVQEEFRLHDLAIEDALRAHQRPKLEEYGDAIFVVLRTAQRGNDHRIAFGETHLFVGPGYVVSVRHGASKPYVEVRQRCESAPHLLKKGPGFVLYAIMDFVVDNYFPVVSEFEERLARLEREIFGQAASREVTMRIYHLKTELLEFKRTVAPLVEVCNRLLRFDTALISEDTKRYFRDVYDHVLRANEGIDTVRELLASALEANLALVGTAQNEVAKKLAGWAAIIAVPTLIVGVYGMNFEFMPELHWRFGYPVVMGTTLAICGTLWWRLRRAGWL
jgi:magnesium transporter